MKVYVDDWKYPHESIERPTFPVQKKKKKKEKKKEELSRILQLLYIWG